MSFLTVIFHYFKRIVCCCDCCDCFKQKKLKQNDIESVADYLKLAKNVIVMTGAGISTNAGIPDFRSPSFGLYERLEKYNLSHPTDVFTLDYFKRNPAPFYHIAHDLFPILSKAKPTVAHYFIKLLNDKGILLRHYTQNIDGLEDLTGLNVEKTIQAHGHIRTGTCLSCGKKFDFEYMKKFVIDDTVPKCDKCAKTVKPDVVLFGEGLPNGFGQSWLDFPKCDMLIIMGTSLVVQPFASLAGKVDNNTPRLLINRDKVGDPNMFGGFITKLLGLNPDFDSESTNSRDVFFQTDCDQGCYELSALLGWEDELKRLIAEQNAKIDDSQTIDI